MDHETAVQLRATERYLLGEFSSEEREAFEEHFFECAECAEDVRAAQLLRANARAVFRDKRVRLAEVAERRGGWWFAWRPVMVSAAANAVLLIALGASLWQAAGLRSRIADATAPRLYPAFGLAQSSRGDRELELPAGTRFFGATLDLLPGQTFERFSYQIQDGSGTTVAQGSAPAPAGAASERTLLVPVSMLAPGRYLFVVNGTHQDHPSEIARAHIIQR